MKKQFAIAIMALLLGLSAKTEAGGILDAGMEMNKATAQQYAQNTKTQMEEETEAKRAELKEDITSKRENMENIADEKRAKALSKSEEKKQSVEAKEIEIDADGTGSETIWLK